jgi:hypothetical protein
MSPAQVSASPTGFATATVFAASVQLWQQQPHRLRCASRLLQQVDLYAAHHVRFVKHAASLAFVADAATG